jgi:uncharacterized protein YcnI
MMRTVTIAGLVLLLAVPAFAHVTVFPQQAPAGASQVYKVRVHNDSKVTTARIEVQIPAGVTVESVAAMATGKSETKKTGDRVTGITWEIEVPPTKYVELAFTAKNPATGASLNWNVKETFKDGSFVEFTDKPGAKEKSSVTKLTRSPAPPAQK